MAYNLEKFAVLTQDYIGKTITSNMFAKVPLFTALALKSGIADKSDMKIGRPGCSEWFAGKPISKAKRESITPGFNAYHVVVHTRTKDNTKKMGSADTFPAVSNWTTESQDQNYGTAKFHWVRYSTPIKVRKESLRRAAGSAAAGLSNKGKAVTNVLENAIDEATNVQISNIASDFWTGNPTNQSADLWDAPAGIQQALDTDNVYGNVDRSSTATWRAKQVTSSTAANIDTIVDTARYDQELSLYQNNAADLILCPPALFKIFKAQIRAKNQLVTNDIPEMGKYGFKTDVLVYDNSYIMLDPNCPANNVACLTLDSWDLLVDPEENFKVSEWIDLPKYKEDADDALAARINTRLILACRNPAANCLFTNVSAS